MSGGRPQITYKDNVFQVERLHKLAKDNGLNLTSILKAVARIALQDPDRVLELAKRLEK